MIQEIFNLIYLFIYAFMHFYILFNLYCVFSPIPFSPFMFSYPGDHHTVVHVMSTFKGLNGDLSYTEPSS